MLPPVLTLLSMALMVLLHTAVPVITVIETPYRFSGLGFVLFGALIVLLSANYFRSINTTIHPFGEPSFLATTSLFKISRNPMYLGMLLMLIGVAICLGTLSPNLVAPLFIWSITNRYIMKEEQKLERIFGEQYLRYKRKVRRWI